jgi:hypothetical protein
MNRVLKIGVLMLTMCILGCKPNTAKTFIDKSIPENTKSEISVLNEKLFKALKDDDKQKVKELLSTVFLKEGSVGLDSVIETAHRYILEANSYSVAKEFYIENSTENVSNTIFSGLSGDYDYIFHYLALNKEMYISMLVPNTEPDQILITCIYGKYPEGWKMNILQVGLYQLRHKNAIDLFKDAQKKYKKGYLIDAVNTLSLVHSCLYPANNFMQYSLDGKINDFCKSIQPEITQKYIFPNELKTIESKPKIFNISLQKVAEGDFPMVEYLTQISIKDTVNLRKENNEINKIIGSIYSGIDKEKKILFYRAWNEMPDGIKQLHTYGFVKRLN